MNLNQKLSPKYWVIHDKTSDDVYLWTGDKNREEAIYLYNNTTRSDLSFEEDEKLECILIEIKEVKV